MPYFAGKYPARSMAFFASLAISSWCAKAQSVRSASVYRGTGRRPVVARY